MTVAPADSGDSDPSYAVEGDAIADEIRVVQSVQTQRSMPTLLLGNLVAAAIVSYLDWDAAVSSYAVYFLAGMIVLLLPMLRSYLRLRRMPRPERVSRRRIRLVEIHSLLLGLSWAIATLLIISVSSPINGVLVAMVTVFLAFGAVAQMPGLPKASAAYFAPMIVATLGSLYVNDIVEADVLFLLAAATLISLPRSAWQGWQDVCATVRLGQEKLQAETEAHQHETEAVRSILEAIPFPLVVTRETGVLHASAQAARQFGISAGDNVSGLNIVDFFVDPVDQQTMSELQEERGRLEEYEVRLKNVRGEPFWASLSTLPMLYEGQDCWLNVVYVIDDRKRAEAQVADARRTAEEQARVLEAVSGQLAKYISPQLYKAIFSGEQRVAIESKRKKLTVFFSDIAGFTEITDQLESEELTALLNQYLTEMSNIAQEHGANFDKFIGDAMMFYFGDPESRGAKEDATACVQMAIAMQRRVRELHDEWRALGIEQPFEIRIGINTGYCTVGNFGSEDRMDYTIIGSEVNLASRLQSHADVGGILLANETYALVKDWLLAEQGDTITVKGFAKPVTTFRVKGIYDELVSGGQVIHRNIDGLSLTIDRDRLELSGKENAIHELENALAQLKD